jgi:hypothetical protein
MAIGCSSSWFSIISPLSLLTLTSSGEFHYQRMPVPEMWLVGYFSQLGMMSADISTGYFSKVPCQWNQCHEVRKQIKAGL